MARFFVNFRFHFISVLQNTVIPNPVIIIISLLFTKHGEHMCSK